MSIIFDPMPIYLQVGGQEIPIDTDFRAWIKFDQALFWSAEPVENRIYSALNICYNGKIPADLSESFNAAIQFYANSAKPVNEMLEDAQNEHSSRGKQTYSFVHDASLICAAFRAQYGIDLTKEHLHWWLFKALFEGLTDENKICKVMEIRGIDLSKIKDKEQKAHYRRLKRLYRLPDPRSEQEQEEDMINALSVMF